LSFSSRLKTIVAPSPPGMVLSRLTSVCVASLFWPRAMYDCTRAKSTEPMRSCWLGNPSDCFSKSASSSSVFFGSFCSRRAMSAASSVVRTSSERALVFS
jgi:hypothetical protein